MSSARTTTSPVRLLGLAAFAVVAFLLAHFALPGVLGAVGSSSRPPAGFQESSSPIGHPPTPPQGSGGYTFMRTQQGSTAPVAYDPCRPVHWVLSSSGAGADAEALVQQAVDRVAQATGLQFVYDGRTDEVSTDQRPAYQPARYGKRWAPVLVAFSDTVANPELAGSVVGQGGSVAVESLGGAGGAVYVTGSISLDGNQLTRAMANGRSVYARAVVEHELGHVVGLDHVDLPGSLMQPESDPSVVDFGAGDLRGLALLGEGRCFPNV